MLNHKTIVTILITILLAVGFAYAEGEEPASSRGKEETGYRMEIILDTIQGIRIQKKEVRFVSPSGEVVKRIKIEPIKLSSPKYEGWLFYADSPVKISGNRKYAFEITKAKEEGRWIRMERILWNAQGKKKWTKEWKTYPHEAEGDPNWDEDICYDGSTVYVSYKDSLRNYWLVVYDTTGKEIAKVSSPYGFREIGIAPDGRIIVAYTGMSAEDRQGYTGDYLFFFSVDEAKKKIVKAWGKNWSVRGYPLKDGKIELSLCEYPSNVVLTFDEIPDDLSKLFSKVGEE